MKSIYISLALLLLPQIVLCATWTVAKDGTGQYSEIQDAIDMAATGDTIIVGPGRYDEFRPYVHGMDIYNCIVHVDGKGLSIIGSGNTTIIGPEEHPVLPSVNNTMGIECHSQGAHQYISNLVVENVYRGVLVINGDIDINYLIAQRCWLGIQVTEYTTGSIANCNINNCLDIGIGLSLVGSPFGVYDCTFYSNTWGFNADWMSNNVVIQNSTFIDNTLLGIQYATSSSGSINNCLVEGSNTGIIIAGTSVVNIINTTCIPTSCWGMHINNGSTVTGYGNIMHGVGTYPAIGLMGSSITMSESHIIKGDACAVFLYGSQYGPDYTFDLRNNYWGTTSAEEIAAMIWDAADDPAIIRFIEYQPFHDQPVSNEDMSFGELKAIFKR